VNEGGRGPFEGEIWRFYLEMDKGPSELGQWMRGLSHYSFLICSESELLNGHLLKMGIYCCVKLLKEEIML
jgi:hypothetical protein